MVPGKLNLKFTQGDDYSRTVTFRVPGTIIAGVDQGDGAVIDYHAYTFAAQIRASAGATVEWPATVDQSQANVGIVVFKWTNAQTAAMPAGGVWDCQITSTGGEITTLLAGSVSVKRQVTR